ncbi:MAG: flagellar basal body P-ring formation chaperone FlgA [Paracoccaceae bacterium]
MIRGGPFLAACKAVVAFLAASLDPAPALADGIVAARTVRAGSVIAAEDLRIAPGPVAGAVATAADALGREARVTLFVGRPVRLGDLTAPTLVGRNAMVTLVYRKAGLEIRVAGRALGRAGAGEAVRVLNVNSHAAVTGLVAADGSVIVANN